MWTKRCAGPKVTNTSFIVSAIAVLPLLASCSSSGDSGSGSKNGSGTGGSSGAGATSGTGGSSGAGGNTGQYAGVLAGVDGRPPSSSTSGGTAVEPVPLGAECAGEEFAGETIPLQIHIMMDRSISMGDSEPQYTLPGGGTKWDAVRIGFENFFGLPQVQTLNAGIDFFGQDTDGCNPDTYSTPEVEIGPMPQAGMDILAAYDQWAPGGNTPMGPALEGALMHGRQWKIDHPGVEVAVVLVTDGVPNGCGPTTADPRGGADTIAPIAAMYATGSPPVPTYVLGIEGMEVPISDFEYVVTTIANAGGTMPVIVQATDDLAQKFADGLEGIRAAAAPPCNYQVPLPPNGETLDLTQVNVELDPVNSAPEPILNVSGPDQCQYGGWYYDPPSDPQTINLCDNTCNVVSDQGGAGFKVLFGCATMTQIR